MYNGLFKQRKFIKLNIINREHINESFKNKSMLKVLTYEVIVFISVHLIYVLKYNKWDRDTRETWRQCNILL